MDLKIGKIISVLYSLFIMAHLHAGIPVFSITPLTPTSFTVPVSSTATVKYRVTNQSSMVHTLNMRPIRGLRQIVTSGNCSSFFTLGYQESCILNLLVTGNALKGNILGGPMLCVQGNSLECYQPSEANSLNIRPGQIPPPIQRYTVTSESGPNGSVSPTTQTVNAGGTVTFTASPNGGYAVREWLVDGVVRQSGGNIFALTNVRKNTVVQVSFGVLLTTNTSFLALARLNSDEGTGAPRQITITNPSSVTISNLVINYPTWPAGTYAEDDCASFSSQNFCTITIFPGETTTSNCEQNATAPAPGVITVNSNNAVVPAINVAILGNSCIYQGGYLFSIDDSTVETESIGGQVVAIEDVPSSPWDGNCPADGPCTQVLQGEELIDGLSNTQAIITALAPATNNAAFLCTAYRAGDYDNWYLPAYCQLGTESTGDQRCAAIYNIQTNVPQISSPSCTGNSCMNGGDFWSSSEYSDTLAYNCTIPCLDISYEPKGQAKRVRCVRNLTSS